jgi:hypothetical protein
MGISYLHYIRRPYKIISLIARPTFQYIPPFFENTVTAHVFKYVSFSTLSFLGFSYAQSFVATDLFNRSGGGVKSRSILIGIAPES